MGHTRPRHHRLRTAAVGSIAALSLLGSAAPALAAPHALDPSAYELIPAPEACAPGYSQEPSFAVGGTGAFGDTSCKLDYLEPFEEKSAANGQAQARTSAPFAATPDGAYAAAVAEREQLLAVGAVTAGGWRTIGNVPLRSDVKAYPRVAGLGLNDISGRMQDLTVDPSDPQHIIGAAAGGGLWETVDGAATWQSIGDRLPTQVLGAGVYVPSTDTYVAGTGDPAYGGSSNEGLGIFWSSDRGATWNRATGGPTSGLTFVIRQSPNDVETLFAGTSKGLFRSTDGGRSFTDLGLPTGCTDLADANCFFANMVTDVVVREGDGAVVAAVGWRAGQKLNANNKMQAPRNGIYRSVDGTPGSFVYQAPTGTGTAAGSPGFGKVVNGENFVGRTTLGRGTGANKDVIVAMVQDVAKFNGDAGIDALDSFYGTVPKNTVLDALYASADFGDSWVKVIDAAQLALPDTGTSLVGASTATYAPGVQSWYNQWVEIDPTSTASTGIRVLFGLEEVWQTSLSTVGIPVVSNTQVIGNYFAGTSCGGFSLGVPVCPLNPRAPAAHTTTHPDQQAGLLVPTGDGGVTLYAGNDGGVYKQTVAGGGAFSQHSWGRGNQGTADGGFLRTLQPYQAVGAKDGTVYAGLQDNGSIKILGQPEQDTDGSTLPAGTMVTTYGGDGFFVATDPDNSRVTWEEYTGGDIRVSTDGGKNWTTKSAGLTSAMFSTPFVMDPYDAGHLMIGGRNIAELTGGAGGSFSTVYNLGTRTQPGVANATATAGNPNNQMSAVALMGKYAYVGYCGFCDIVTQGLPFNSGIATNVTPADDAKIKTGQGWHIAAANGLPKRYVTGVRMDPENPATVYVTLGGYGRRWIPPGSLADDISKIGTGHLYKSTDGGENFVDISGSLPDVPANDVLVRDNQLIVATDLGVYASGDKNGNGFTVLGSTLPNVSVFKLEVMPEEGMVKNGPTSSILAATYGRGIYAFDFPTDDGNPTPVVPEAPIAVLLPLVALGLAAGVVLRRRRTLGGVA